MDDQPLAEELRPTELASFVGQEKLTGPDGLVTRLLRSSAESRFFPSLIFWGPPGCGKTTLARLIARSLGREFFEFSAVNASIKDIEKIIPRPSAQLTLEKKSAPVVFIDEIHRFSKTQQDALLPHVERGSIVFLGATTENPSFSVIGALLSRCRVLTLQRLSDEELERIVERALGFLHMEITEEGRQFLLSGANGDARTALTVLDIASHISRGERLDVADLETALQRRQLTFDNKGEEFYNTISALHKSIRGSDPDAAVYWLARMLEAGQDPLYVGRRLIRMASEDIGLAQPNALLVANAAYDTCSKLGMPECSVALAQACAYLAKAPKSNAVYLAYGEAAADVQQFGNLPVPLHIRNAPTKLMRDEGYGKDYDYHHSPTGERRTDICYLPEEVKEKRYFNDK